MLRKSYYKVLNTRNRKVKSKEDKMKLWLKILPVGIGLVFAFGMFISVKDNNTQIKDLFLRNNLSCNTESDNAVSFKEREKLLTIVNLQSPISESYNLELVKYENISCDKIVVENLDKMIKAARKDGIELTLKSGYIDEKSQDALYAQKVQELLNINAYSSLKAQVEAEKIMAPGNKSENQTGLLIKFEFSDTDDSDEYRWLVKNSTDYGFILRCPENKKSETGKLFSANSFRYVGVENAKRMRTFDMCLEEYAEYISLQKNI